MSRLKNHSLPDDQFRQNAIKKVALNNVNQTVLGSAIAFGVFTIIHYFSTYDPTRFVSMEIAAATAIVFFAFYFVIQKAGLSEKYVLAVTGGMVTLIMFVVLGNLYVEGDLRETVILVILIIGSGYFLLSSRWYAGVLAMTLCGWGLVAHLIGASGEEIADFSIGILAGVFTSGMIHLSRRMMVFRYESLIRNEQLARAEMEEKEARYRALFDQTGDAIFIANPNGDIQEVNPVAIVNRDCVP